LNLSNGHDALCEIETNGDDIRSLSGIQTCALPRETDAGLQGTFLADWVGLVGFATRQDESALSRYEVKTALSLTLPPCLSVLACVGGLRCLNWKSISTIAARTEEHPPHRHDWPRSARFKTCTSRTPNAAQERFWNLSFTAGSRRESHLKEVRLITPRMEPGLGNRAQELSCASFAQHLERYNSRRTMHCYLFVDCKTPGC
jgi:hypothetical protein